MKKQFEKKILACYLNVSNLMWGGIFGRGVGEGLEIFKKWLRLLTEDGGVSNF